MSIYAKPVAKTAKDLLIKHDIPSVGVDKEVESLDNYISEAKKIRESYKLFCKTMSFMASSIFRCMSVK